MRRPERIPIFLDLISGRFIEIFNDIWKLTDRVDFHPSSDLRSIDKIKEFWLENPDLRFSQVLVNLGIIPNLPGFWYYIEENEILEQLGIEPREYLLWGQVFDKDMNRLPEPIYRPIKDLETGHIQAILDGDWCRLDNYKECFENELKLRGIT